MVVSLFGPERKVNCKVGGGGSSFWLLGGGARLPSYGAQGIRICPSNKILRRWMCTVRCEKPQSEGSDSLPKLTQNQDLPHICLSPKHGGFPNYPSPPPIGLRDRGQRSDGRRHGGSRRSSYHNQGEEVREDFLEERECKWRPTGYVGILPRSPPAQFPSCLSRCVLSLCTYTSARVCGGGW